MVMMVMVILTRDDEKDVVDDQKEWSRYDESFS